MNRKSNIVAIVITTLVIGLLVVIKFTRKPPVNWEPTFSKFHTWPYGNKALFQLLPDLFPKQTIAVNRTNLYDFFSTYQADSTNFILITKFYQPSRYLVNKMLAFIKKGNHVFICADIFMPLQTYFINSVDSGKYSWSWQIPKKNGKKIEIQIYLPNKKKWQPFTFDHFVADKYFDIKKKYVIQNADTTYLEELENINRSNFAIYKFGKLNDTMPNLLKIIYGKGSMILCANPLIFTNFNLLEGKHASYIGNVLSELPVQKVVWDEYTNSGPVGLESANTPIRFILSKPALRNAYYLLMLILILFIVFKSKRRQSTIPVVEPPKNSTKLFVETIGRLYFNKSNPKNMGQKKARFFLSFISKKLNINTQKRDAQFLNHLHIASGLSMNLIKDLNKGIERALNPNEFFSATDLVELTENINTFKHKTK